MKGYRKYYLNKVLWLLVTAVFAFVLNFALPRLMPGDPIAAIVARLAQGMSNSTGMKEVYEQYAELFGTNKPIIQQFFMYVNNVFHGNFGSPSVNFPDRFSDILKASIWWTVALQFPAIIVGWLIGNTLGALAAYLQRGFDKVLMPVSIFVSNLPAFGMAIILLVIFGVNLKWFPTSGGYGFDLIPESQLEIYLVRDRSLPTSLLVDRVDRHWRSGDWHAFHVDL